MKWRAQIKVNASGDRLITTQVVCADFPDAVEMAAIHTTVMDVFNDLKRQAVEDQEAAVTRVSIVLTPAPEAKG